MASSRSSSRTFSTRSGPPTRRLSDFGRKAESPEPVFVKNLENVQGDEREVIIFSCAVGADVTGRVTAQISSLNNEGGHRRLNVAITRARREMIVFSEHEPGADRPWPVERARDRRFQALPRIRQERTARHRRGLRADRPRHGVAVRGCGEAGARGQELGRPSAGRRLLFPRGFRNRPSGQAWRLSLRASRPMAPSSIARQPLAIATSSDSLPSKTSAGGS